MHETLERLLNVFIPVHPWRRYTIPGSTAWKLIPLLGLSAVCVAVTIIMDSLMAAGYSTIEFAFSNANFRTAMIPFLTNPVSSQIFCLSGGFHFLTVHVYFATVTVAVCWAANCDKSRWVGDMIAWGQLMGWAIVIIAHSLIMAAFIGFPPPGFFYAEIVFTIWGIQLISGDVTLAMGVIYAVVIRILKWTVWKDVDNTPVQMKEARMEAHRAVSHGAGDMNGQKNGIFPADLIVCILSDVTDPPTLLAAARTCKKYNDLINKHKLWDNVISGSRIYDFTAEDKLMTHEEAWLMLGEEEVLPSVKGKPSYRCFTVCVVGEGNSGKTASTIQFCSNHFVEEYDPTIEDSYRKMLAVGQRGVLFDILDTAGCEEFSWERHITLRSVQSFVVMYSCTSRSGFEYASTPMRLIRQKRSDCSSVLLVCNKVDLEEQRTVSTKEGLELARQFKTGYCETSAKTRFHIEEEFKWLLQQFVATTVVPTQKTSSTRKCCLM